MFAWVEYCLLGCVCDCTYLFCFDSGVFVSVCCDALCLSLLGFGCWCGFALKWILVCLLFGYWFASHLM